MDLALLIVPQQQSSVAGLFQPSHPANVRFGGSDVGARVQGSPFTRMQGAEQEMQPGQQLYGEAALRIAVFHAALPG
jgi:hypothetical protein